MAAALALAEVNFFIGGWVPLRLVCACEALAESGVTDLAVAVADTVPFETVRLLALTDCPLGAWVADVLAQAWVHQLQGVHRRKQVRAQILRLVQPNLNVR